MYQEEYQRWLAADLEDTDLRPELVSIQGIDEEIKDRFAVSLAFGTAGLRGVLGAGTNRMNIYVVRQATQGLANWVKTQGGTQTVAISYDSRIKSDVFARETAACWRRRHPCAHLQGADARAGAELCHALLPLQRGRDGDRQPQPVEVQRLQGLRAGRLPADRRGRRRRCTTRSRASTCCTRKDDAL